MDDIRPRCGWCNLSNPVYVAYHDAEWAVPSHDDHHLFEMLVLETFQAGLSWETILNKRERFPSGVRWVRHRTGSGAMTRTRSPNS